MLLFVNNKINIFHNILLTTLLLCVIIGLEVLAMKIGKNIRNIRKSRGLTQEEVAERMGLVKATISSWEIDRTRPNMAKLEELCEALCCQKSDIVGKDEIAVSRQLTPEEWELIVEYRNSDELSREAVRRLLRYKEAFDELKKNGGKEE